MFGCLREFRAEFMFWRLEIKREFCNLSSKWIERITLGTDSGLGFVLGVGLSGRAWDESFNEHMFILLLRVEVMIIYSPYRKIILRSQRYSVYSIFKYSM